ncbi:hypothetical protein BLNAU_1920 [Blattamonas nauphoetae]|uniref:Uncharacterized protein n=1 Tax=Blattamonas nauphoetae TaxID=2049346 RepID=A0ABQ9YGL3_9EUKA|nr:hypothetical protein BLNAU_1920 [Blattamonas nauphoetae]
MKPDDPPHDLHLQVFILSILPNIFAPSPVPVIVFFALHLILALIFLTLAVFHFDNKKRRRSTWKIAFFLIMFSHSFFYALLTCVPFPFNRFTVTFLANQMLQNLFYLAWQCLSLWLLKAIVSSHHSFFFHRLFPTILFVLVGILFTVSVILSLPYFSRYGSTPDTIISITSCLFHFLLSLSIAVYSFRFLYLSTKLKNQRKLRTKVTILGICLFSACGILFARSVHNLLTSIGISPIGRKSMQALFHCYSNEKQCLPYTLSFFFFYFGFSLLPCMLFLLVSVIPSVSPGWHGQKRSKSNGAKKIKKNATQNAPQLHQPSLSFYHDTDDYTDVTAVLPSPETNQSRHPYYSGPYTDSGMILGMQNPW